MNGPLAFAVASTLLVAGAGPFLAVHIGGKVFEPEKRNQPRASIDDTTQIPRVTDEVNRYMY